MDKHVYVWHPPEPDIAVFTRAGADAIARRLDGIAFSRATIHVTHVAPPRFSLVPFRREPMALVSLTGSTAELDLARTALSRLPGALHVYAVEESVPVEPPPSAPVTLVTLFRMRPGIERALFDRRWHEEHTPMTLEIHPITGYVKNVVVRPLDPASPSWDGIVTEDFAHPSDVTTLRLFGRGPRAIANAVRIGRHVSSFLDLRTIETYLTRSRSRG